MPVGAGAKEHGLHLPMNTDQIQAEWLADRLAAAIDGLIWPTLIYGFYPAFVRFSGSNTLPYRLFRTMVAELVDGLIGHGARAVFVIDTGISTIEPISMALSDARFAGRPTI